MLSLGCQATEFRAFLGDCLSCEEALNEDRNVLTLWIVEDHLKGHTEVCWNVVPKCRTFLIPSLQRCEEGNLWVRSEDMDSPESSRFQRSHSHTGLTVLGCSVRGQQTAVKVTTFQQGRSQNPPLQDDEPALTDDRGDGTVPSVTSTKKEQESHTSLQQHLCSGNSDVTPDPPQTLPTSGEGTWQGMAHPQTPSSRDKTGGLQTGPYGKNTVYLVRWSGSLLGTV